MLNYIKSHLTVYTTTRLVEVKSKSLAIIYLTLVITVWCCLLISYNLDLRKLYQKTCKANGAVIISGKGSLSTLELNDTVLGIPNSDLYKRVWDNSDLILQSNAGSSALAVVTNVIITPQTRGVCARTSPVCTRTMCRINTRHNCTRNEYSPTQNGIMTGRYSKTARDCEVFAWCPIENEILPFNETKALLEDVKNFTVMIKNVVEFWDFGIQYQGRNLLQNCTDCYLAECHHHPIHDPNCPVFRIRDIVEWSHENFSTIAIKGGIIRMEINWNCDFDWSKTIEDCQPTYQFSRIDKPEAQVAPGWKFQSASYHEENRRTLHTFYGIKILVEVTGEGKRFDFLTLILSLGASIGFFAVAPLACDLLLHLFAQIKKICKGIKFFSVYSTKSRIYGDIDQDDRDITGSRIWLTNYDKSKQSVLYI